MCVNQGEVILFSWELYQELVLFMGTSSLNGASQVALVVKNLPANARDPRDVGSISGSGRCPGVGNGNPLQYSYLENSIDRGAWWAIVHGVTKSQTELSKHLLFTAWQQVKEAFHSLTFSR